MHARIARTSRLAVRAVHSGWTARVAAPSSSLIASPSAPLQTRLFRTSSPFANSQEGHIPLSSEPLAKPSSAPKDDPTAHAEGSQPHHIPLEEAAAGSSSPSSAEPSSSPAPIDSETATTLPTEEIPAVSSSLDTTSSSTSSASEPTPSRAPIDNETATNLSTEEIPAVSSSLDATQSSAVSAEEEQRKVASTLFVGGLSWNVEEDWLEDEVYAILGRGEGVSSIRIARNHQGRSKGFAFIEMQSPELAQQLVGTKPTIDGREVEFKASGSSTRKPVREPKDPQAYISQGPRNPPSQTVWLGNVAWAADEAALEKIFSRFGEILRIGQPKDFETGRSRGIAYIEYATMDAARAAVEHGFARGFRVDGRPVRIDYASAGQRGTNKGRLGSRAGGMTKSKRDFIKKHGREQLEQY
ncbi:hypothetical protein JCM8547_006905 [Rhodosporidiobolus lusitaniae]